MPVVNRENYFDSRPFLKGKDIKDKAKVTIEAFEEITTRVSKKPRPCLRLKGYEAPLGLNVTNFNTLLEKLGENTDRWKGKQITLRVIMAPNPQNDGKEQKAIRIE